MARTIVTLLGVCLLAGCQSAFVRPEATIDTTLGQKLKARRAAEQAPATAWQTVIRYPEVDDWIPVGEHHVLVGMRELAAGRLVTTAHVAMLSFGPYVLFDARTGREAWTFARQADFPGRYSAIPTSRAIVMQQADEKGALLTGVDPATGKTLWTRAFSPRPAMALSLAHNLLVLSPAGAGGGVAALDLESGATRWSALLASASDVQPTLHVGDEHVLVIAEEGVALALDSGVVRWRAGGLGPLANAQPRRVAEGVALPSADGRLTLLRDDGKVAWRAALGGAARRLSCSEAACYAEVEGSSAQTRLVATDLQRGAVLWRQALPSRMSSPIHVAAATLYFTDGGRVVARDLASGAERAATALPDARRLRLADALLVQGERLVVAMENGVAAYRVDDLATAWSYQLRGQELTLYETTAASLARALTPGPQVNNPAAAKRKQEEWNDSFNRSVMDASASFYDALTDQTASAARVQSGRASAATSRAATTSHASDRNTARFERGMSHVASQRAYAAQAAEARFERDKAMRELSHTIATAGSDVLVAALNEYGRKAEREATLARLSARVDMALKLHERAVLGRYYVRPYGRAGVNGVLLVDLEEGSWCEVPTSPNEAAEAAGKFLDTNLGVAAAGVLVTKGTGFDTARWERDQRYGSVVTVHRSLLGVELGQLAFKPAKDY